MPTIDSLAEEFLAQRRIAVAGVSATRQDAANLIYRTLRKRDKLVFAVNPRIATFDGDPCYPDLAALPETPDAVVIITGAAGAEDLVRQCIAAGVRRVWMHNVLGTHPRFMKATAARIGSVSDEAVRRCRENGIAVIPGSCPMQFVGDVVHKCMRGVLRVTGALEIPK